MSDYVSNVFHKEYFTCQNGVTEADRDLYDSINNAYILDALNQLEKYEKNWEFD